jgi:hypothetical protein
MQTCPRATRGFVGRYSDLNDDRYVSVFERRAVHFQERRRLILFEGVAARRPRAPRPLARHDLESSSGTGRPDFRDGQFW